MHAVQASDLLFCGAILSVVPFFKMYKQKLTNENTNSSKKNLNHNLNTILFSGSLMALIITALTSGR